MIAKQFLRKIRRLDQEITAKQDDIVRQRSRSEKMTSSLQNIKEVSSEEQDRMAGAVAQVIDLVREMNRLVSEYASHKARAIMLLEQMTDSRYKLVLTLYYLNRNTWDDVAWKMGYTRQWVHQLHGQALKEFQKIMENTKSC